MAAGGKRKGAGRPKGVVNRVTVEARATISEMAKAYTDIALEALATIAQRGDSESARVSAAVALLNRAYGQSPQAMELTGKDGGPVEMHEVSPTEVARRLAFLLTSGAESAITKH